MRVLSYRGETATKKKKHQRLSKTNAERGRNDREKKLKESGGPS